MKHRNPFVFISWLGLLLLAACTLVQPKPTTVEQEKTPMTDLAATTANAAKPDYVTALERAYGAPSQAAFGSAVFYEPLPVIATLDEMALAKYQFFVGDLWARYGADAWLRPWRRLYTRPPGTTRNIVIELHALPDRAAAQVAALLLEDVEDPEGARAALVAAFDDSAVAELAIYNVGDSGVMSGILVAGWRQAPQTATFLVFLID